MACCHISEKLPTIRCVIICIFYRWRSILLSRRKSRILFRHPQPSSLPPPCFISFHLYLKPFLCLNPALAATTLMQDLHQSMQILTLCWILQNWHPNKISRLPKSTATIRLGWGRESFLPSKNMLAWKVSETQTLHDRLNASGNLLQ